MSNRAKSAGILAGFGFFAADIDFPRLVALKEAEPRGQRAAGIFAHAPREGPKEGRNGENSQNGQKTRRNKKAEKATLAERQHFGCQPYTIHQPELFAPPTARNHTMPPQATAAQYHPYKHPHSNP